MQDICTMATYPSDVEDDEQLIVVGVISSPKTSDKSTKMKGNSPEKKASLPTENKVKRGRKRSVSRKLESKPQKRSVSNKLSNLNSESDLDDEVIVVGRTSMVMTKQGDCEAQEEKLVTCRKFRDEALHELNVEDIILQNAYQTGVVFTSERKETEQGTTSMQLDENDCFSSKDVPCLAVSSDTTPTLNLSSALKDCDVEHSVSYGVKSKPELERIPLKPKKRGQHRKTDCRRKRKRKGASLEAVQPYDNVEGETASKQTLLWFENLGETGENELPSTLGDQRDVNGHLETNNNDRDSKDAETAVTRQSTSLSEMDSDDELIDPSLEIDEEDFNEGDLVWAQHPRNPFWPAVVKDISNQGRQKKITIEFFNRGADVYRCQYSVRAIRPFIQYRKKLINAGCRSEQSESFQVAVQEAMEYLRERAVGKDIAFTTPVKEALSDQPNLHCQSFDSPPLTPTECQTTPLTPGASCSTPSNGHHSPPSPKVRIGLAGLFSNSEVSEETIAKEKEKAKLRKKWDKIEDRLMKIILKDETKERLLRIWKGKVKCERHKIFFSSSIKERDSLKYSAHLGALTSEEKIDKIANYLNEIWRHNCQKNKDDLPNNAYIFEVWLPEAILYAVMKSRKIGVKKAEQVLITEGRQVVKELEME